MNYNNLFKWLFLQETRASQQPHYNGLWKPSLHCASSSIYLDSLCDTKQNLIQGLSSFLPLPAITSLLYTKFNFSWILLSKRLKTLLIFSRVSRIY